MNVRSALLGLFVALTIVFASTTVYEMGFRSTFTSTSTVTTTSTVMATSVPTTTSSTTLTQSSAACPSNATCGSITHASTGQVLVQYVQVTKFVINGQSYVGFAVTFVNAGNSSIYVPAGTTGVSTSVLPDSILRQVSTLICPGFFAVDKLDPGQNYTSFGPSCNAGYEYQLVQPGSVTVSFSFNWATNSKASAYPTDFPNSTTVSAQFVFASP